MRYQYLPPEYQRLNICHLIRFETYRRALIMLALSVSATISALSQNFVDPNAWRTQRHEYFIGGGAANFMGELGGLDKVGSEFLWDFEITMTAPAANIGYKYYLARRLAWRHVYTWGILQGNDNLTNELFRRNRNLHFKTHIHEYSQILEWQFLQEKPGNRYKLHNKSGRKIGMKDRNFGMFLTAGVSVFYFNPKAQYNGSWVALQPLGTEGQGLSEDEPKKYSRVSIGFPVGFGFRTKLSKQWHMSLDLSYRFTLTDYIDDVSTDYYNNAELESARGEAAAYLADPSLGIPESGWPAQGYIADQQRGDPTDRDGYMFVTLNFHYRPVIYKKGKKRSKRYKRFRAFM